MDEPACPDCRALLKRVGELEAQVAELTRRLDEALRAGKRQAAIRQAVIVRKSSQIGTTAAALFSDTGLGSSSTFYYRVRAYNAAGDSANSNTGSATTQSSACASEGTTSSKLAPSATALTSVRLRMSASLAPLWGEMTLFRRWNESVLPKNQRARAPVVVTPGASMPRDRRDG